MAVVYPPDHPLTIEMAKWNKPYRYEEYPRTLYKAQTRPDGKASVSESLDSIFPGGQSGAAESFNRSCQYTVRSDDEKQKALEAGWRLTQAEAMAFREQRDKTEGDIAAARHYEDRNMSEAAKAEAERADAESFSHLPEIERKPIRKRGRPVKVKSESQAAN